MLSLISQWCPVIVRETIICPMFSHENPDVSGKNNGIPVFETLKRFALPGTILRLSLGSAADRFGSPGRPIEYTFLLGG